MAHQPPHVQGFEQLVHIATGGFASVYRAVDSNIGRTVAIKVLDRVDMSGPTSRERFLRETHAMGRLSGLPHIVDIYHATFTDSGVPCIVMPYMAGGSLATYLQDQGPLTPNQAITLGIAIARALDAAHERGLSHRDIKPENLLLDENGNPGLADFGIALTEGATASTRTRLTVSPEHAPPERLAPPADGVRRDTAGDIYSLASTLYTLTTGSAPFGSEADLGSYEFVRRVVEQPPPRLEIDGADPGFGQALQRAMAKDPGERFATAGAMATALEKVPHQATAITVHIDPTILQGLHPGPTSTATPTQPDGGNPAPAIATAGAAAIAATGTPAQATVYRGRPAAPDPFQIEPEPTSPNRKPLLIGAIVALVVLAVGAAFLIGSRSASSSGPDLQATGNTSATTAPSTTSTSSTSTSTSTTTTAIPTTVSTAPPPPETVIVTVTVPPTVTTTARSASVSTASASQLDSGWAVRLASSKPSVAQEVSDISSLATRVQARYPDADIYDSDDLQSRSSLTPGYLVLLIGGYRDKASAEATCNSMPSNLKPYGCNVNQIR